MIQQQRFKATCTCQARWVRALSTNVTQRRPLSSCSLQWQRLPLEWAVDITEIELMDPISCPTTWPVLLNIRGETTNYGATSTPVVTLASRAVALG